MSYLRVLPRDAFNEANFLKCIAQLTMALEDGFFPFITYAYDGEPFELHQDVNGCLYINNMNFYYNEHPLEMKRPLNSLNSWPLYIETENDSLSVFDEKGNITLTKKQLNMLFNN